MEVFLLILVLTTGAVEVQTPRYDTLAACQSAAAAKLQADKRYATYVCSKRYVAAPTTPPAPKYSLTLYFACGYGCGDPPQVTLPDKYATLQDCANAGKVWLSPAANPQNAVRTYLCTH